VKRANTKAVEATAYHEAGHAVMAFQLGIRLQKITIVPDEESSGCCHHESLLKFKGSARLKIEKLVMICLAGPLAQQKFKPRSIRSYHASSDYSVVARVAAQLNGSLEASTYIKWLAIRARTKLDQPMTWKFVRAVAHELITKKEITGKSLPDIFARVIR
jgi:ATP-dependent Zn protease